VSDEEERKFRCTKCGRIGTVGRCCGRNTQVAIVSEGHLTMTWRVDGWRTNNEEKADENLHRLR